MIEVIFLTLLITFFTTNAMLTLGFKILTIFVVNVVVSVLLGLILKEI